MYYRKGKYNVKKKEQLQTQIQHGERPQKWYSEKEYSEFEKRRIHQKTSTINSAISKEKIGDLLLWLQT